MVHSALYLAPFLAASAHAALNDWTKPCFSGSCSYDLPAQDGAASGSLTIWGSENLLTDITPAAGWAILDCSPSATNQTIRLVCEDEGAGCDHLFKQTGAEGKIVRLPEACGANAFARVAKSYDAKDQSLPASFAKLRRRDGKQPTVRALDLDTEFASMDPSTAGSVGFAIQGLNRPGFASKPISTPSLRARRSPHTARQIGDIFEDAGGLFEVVFDEISQGFEIDETINVPPIELDEEFNLIDVSVGCAENGVGAGITVDIAAKGTVSADIGVIAVGTVVPPVLTKFNTVTRLNSDVVGTVTLGGSVTGAIDTGEITLFEIGIPGLNFPGIFQLGPAFQINTLLGASLEAQATVAIDLNFKATDALIVFPADAAQESASELDVGDTNFDLAVSPGVKVTGTIEAHLIPTVRLPLVSSSLPSSILIFPR
ncbi:hypothetical protein BDV98DRAFT_513349 [Pterulicium gracile]|uniref:Uncharacterized protein n=1 Tax=Pterulicium gracile TaxID=1884261 RepID=A0A5C3Q6M4_9AGAR|nr:hypothetical protein BDV98DRAFT_513349 [Pterula gracilis]